MNKILEILKRFHLPIIVFLLLLVIVLGTSNSIGWRKYKEVSVLLEQELTSSAVPEQLKGGEVGEGEKMDDKVPAFIPNTAGVIKGIRENAIVVAGTGSNFADKKPRDLTVILTDTTITMKVGGDIKYIGLEGLEYLNLEMEVSINGEENIRGKTEFKAKYIYIL